MKKLVEAETGYSSLDILLDETLCAGGVWLPAKWVQEVGGINQRLKAKQKYEILIRVAQAHPFEIREVDQPENGDIKLVDMDADEWNQIKTDCYITGRYSRILQEKGFFNAAVSGILMQARLLGIEKQAIAWMEEMLTHGKEYARLEEAISPILIYKGEGVCHNVLNVFAEQLGSALQKCGERVEYFDTREHPLGELTRYIGKYYKAIIAIQSFVFGIKLQDGNTYLHEKIHGPKFNYIFDHPVWLKEHLQHEYPDFYVLTHDRNYVAFYQKYYKKKAIHFPVPGMERCETEKKKYDITFVGAIGDVKEELRQIYQMKKPDRYLANYFLLVMKQHPHMTAEAAFMIALHRYYDAYKDEEWFEIFYRMRRVIYAIIHYYRNRVIKSILEKGIELHVFGDGWQHSPLRRYRNLICHDSVTVEESLKIYEQSWMSLNVMSWHKDGFTERMANIMLAKAVLITDATDYLLEQYADGTDIITFDLEHIEILPERIASALKDKEMLATMAASGYARTKALHTWDKAARNFLVFVEEISEQ